jgi:hypothetical protein
MWQQLKMLVKHCLTGKDGETYDPARVVGYPAALAGVTVFLFNSVYVVVHTKAFDPQAFGLGFGGVMAGVAAVAGGVAWKSKTEPGH